MTGLAPLIREFRIAYYQRARAELQQRDPMHADLPGIVRKLSELVAERAPMQNPLRHRVEASGLHQHDGGHTYSYGVVFPIEHAQPAVTQPPARNLLRDAIVVLLLHAALCAAAVALGAPISIPF